MTTQPQSIAQTALPRDQVRGDEWPHLAAVRVCPRERTDTAGVLEAAPALADWAVACYRLTPRVERTGMWGALLDLGTCTDGEALEPLRDLVGWLATAGLRARIGVGPTGVLARLAGLAATSDRPIALLAPAEVPASLRRAPVGALLHLLPPESLTPELRPEIRPEIVERLHTYGVRTLEHLARLGELALRRQFGAAGSALFAAAQGRDARPLCPTPPPAELRIRVRFASPATPEEVVALLPRLARRVAAQLDLRGRRARSLRLVVRSEGRGVARSHLALRQYTGSPALLAHELRRLLLRIVLLMPPHPIQGLTEDQRSRQGGHDWQGPHGRIQRIEGLYLVLADFAPATPAQAAFWPTRRQRAVAIEVVAQALARRHGRSLILRPRLATPAAIFSEERYAFSSPGLAPVVLPYAAPDVMPDAPGVTGRAGWSEVSGPWGDADVAGAPCHQPRRQDRPRPSRPYAPRSPIHADSVQSGADVETGDVWQRVPQRLHWW